MTGREKERKQEIVMERKTERESRAKERESQRTGIERERERESCRIHALGQIIKGSRLH